MGGSQGSQAPWTPQGTLAPDSFWLNSLHLAVRCLFAAPDRPDADERWRSALHTAEWSLGHLAIDPGDIRHAKDLGLTATTTTLAIAMNLPFEDAAQAEADGLRLMATLNGYPVDDLTDEPYEPPTVTYAASGAVMFVRTS